MKQQQLHVVLYLCIIFAASEQIELATFGTVIRKLSFLKCLCAHLPQSGWSTIQQGCKLSV